MTITTDDWNLSDEGLLDKLIQDPDTKDLVILDYLARIPHLVVCVHLRGCLQDYKFANRAQAKELIEKVLSKTLNTRRVLGYAFVDAGAFEKRLEFVDIDHSAWSVGTSSSSTVLYGFVRSEKPCTHAESERATNEVLAKLGVSSQDIIRSRLEQSVSRANEHQRSFNLASA